MLSHYMKSYVLTIRMKPLQQYKMKIWIFPNVYIVTIAVVKGKESQKLIILRPALNPLEYHMV